eukprot:1499706-Pyramimonas_sp.AAC.1
MVEGGPGRPRRPRVGLQGQGRLGRRRDQEGAEREVGGGSNERGKTTGNAGMRGEGMAAMREKWAPS